MHGGLERRFIERGTGVAPNLGGATLTTAPILGGALGNADDDRGRALFMRLLVRKRLSDFWAKHKVSEQPLRAWLVEVQNARWQNAAEVRRRYGSADFVGDRIVFDIGGNKFRLIVRVKYADRARGLNGILFVRFIGTHKEYDAIDAATV